MSNSKKALVKRDDFVALAKNRERVMAVIEANLGGGGSVGAFTLPRVTVPSSGGQAWSIPTAQGDESEQNIDAIVLAHTPCRAYWPNDFVGNVPPACSSPDGMVGYGKPGGECGSCLMSQWGSDGKSRGQACKAMWRLFLLRPRAVLPYTLTLPPTSIKAWQAYLAMLTNSATPYYLAITRIGLKSAQSQDGIKYSVATFAQIDEVSEDEEERIEEYKALLEPYLTAPVQFDEVGAPGGGGIDT